MENKVPYIHDTQVHNLQAPKEIVPILIKMFSPESVVDVGCGLGTFLRVFKENGITNILGIDGPWVDKSLLFENISPDFFLETDLNEEIHLTKKFDIALCLEVAEHLHIDNANNIVSTLTNLSDVIVFSAAIPGQGGQNHINEQWLTYWEKKFNSNDYFLYDIIRPQIWDNPNVFFWYKQNMVVFGKKGLVHDSFNNNTENSIKNLVHPDLYLHHLNMLLNCQADNDHLTHQINRLYSGTYPISTYIKMLKNFAKARIKKNMTGN